MNQKRKKLEKADLHNVFAGTGNGTVMNIGVFRPNDDPEPNSAP